MIVRMEITEIQQKIEPVLRSHGVTKASVFGSYARGDAGEDSDVDICVRLGKPMGLVAYVRFVEQIESALQKKVDVVTEKSISKYMRPFIETDLKTIYGS